MYLYILFSSVHFILAVIKTTPIMTYLLSKYGFEIMHTGYNISKYIITSVNYPKLIKNTESSMVNNNNNNDGYVIL